MVSGVSAYQQQASLAQSIQSSNRTSVQGERRDTGAQQSSPADTIRDTARADRARATDPSNERSESRRPDAPQESSTGQIGLGGKDAAQRRGSLLDVKA
jgi:hypothetical protein